MVQTPRNEIVSAPAVNGMSRRTFIGAAGAAGIVAATARVTPALAANGQRSFLGSNHDPFNQIQSAVPGLRGVRMYGPMPVNGVNQWPNPIAWPTGPDPTPATQGPIVYSIYPIPSTVIDGDAFTMGAIRQIILSAPPGSYMSAWHEARSLSSSTPPPPDNTPARLKLMHSILNGMCLGTNVTYGSIFAGDADFTVPGSTPNSMCPPLNGKPQVWGSVPTDLGFYGVDPYANNDKAPMSTNLCWFDTFITSAKTFTKNDPFNSGYPMLLVAETNSNVESERPQWFNEVCSRMATYGANSIGVLTFWHPKGPLSGAWDPSDQNTITEMNSIISSVF